MRKFKNLVNEITLASYLYCEFKFGMADMEGRGPHDFMEIRVVSFADKSAFGSSMK